jgi:hypothetical protein
MPAQIKERPILFSPPMIKAILENRKTQTRRIIKPQPPNGCAVGFSAFSGKDRVEFRRYPSHKLGGHQSFVKCPYGQPGDRLWVRETWGTGTRPDPHDGWHDGLEYRADQIGLDEHDDLPLHIVSEEHDLTGYKKGWHPSIHMPRWASRITLEITQIRVERLQQISEADAVAEGVECPRVGQKCNGQIQCGDTSREPQDCVCADGYIVLYKLLWERINGRGSWEKNPWVWVLGLKRV